MSFWKLKRPAEALPAFEQAASFEPRHLGARLNRGNALVELGRFEEAIAQYDGLLAMIPGHAEIHFNCGNALRGLARELEAIAAYDRALAARPNYAKALINRGIALQTLGRQAEALASFCAVLAVDKNNADARHNEALALLTLGDFRRGFEAYEARWERAGMPPRRRFGKPLWLGEFALARKTILLHAEQGLGDTLQFVRYAPILARAGAKVLLEVQPELKTILARVEGIAGVTVRGEPLPAFDVHCPVGSLPLALRTEPATIPAAVPYVSVTDERLDTWRTRLDALPRPRVALAWAGNASHANDRNRSVALSRLAPLLAWNAGAFISIQRELRDEDAATLAQIPRMTHVGEELADFDDDGSRRGARRSGDHGRHFGRTPCRRARPSGLDSPAILAGLALDARSRRQPLVSDGAPFPPERAGRLGRRDCTDRRGVGERFAGLGVARSPLIHERDVHIWPDTLAQAVPWLFRPHIAEFVSIPWDWSGLRGSHGGGPYDFQSIHRFGGDFPCHHAGLRPGRIGADQAGQTGDHRAGAGQASRRSRRRLAADAARPIRRLGRLHRHPRRQEGVLHACQAENVDHESTGPRSRSELLVHFDPSGRENVKNEVSVIIGYPFKPSTDASAEVGTTKFAMYTQNDGAWIKNVTEEARMIDAMRKGSDLTVKGTSGRGTQSTDQYSLKGLTEALAKIEQECK